MLRGVRVDMPGGLSPPWAAEKKNTDNIRNGPFILSWMREKGSTDYMA